MVSLSRLLSLTPLKCNSTQFKISIYSPPPPPYSEDPHPPISVAYLATYCPKVGIKKVPPQSPVVILEVHSSLHNWTYFPPQNNNTPSFYLVFYTLICSVTRAYYYAPFPKNAYKTEASHRSTDVKQAFRLIVTTVSHLSVTVKPFVNSSAYWLLTIAV